MPCRNPSITSKINTNGLRLAHDQQLIELLAAHRGRLEVFFQLDGLREDITSHLRGEPLLDKKLQAIEQLGRSNVHITLAVTLQGGINDDQYGPLVRFGLERPWITGINFQPATYSGRHVLPDQLHARITFPDVIKGICRQTDGLFRETDFMPLPCAHPNCHSIAYAYRRGEVVVPLSRFLDARGNLDLLANGIAFTRPQAQDLMANYLSRLGCCSGNCDPDASVSNNLISFSTCSQSDGQQNLEQSAGQEFFSRVLAGELGGPRYISNHDYFVPGCV